MKKPRLKRVLNKLSRFLYYLTPIEFKEDSLLVKLDKQKAEEVWDIFSKELKTCLRFFDMKSIRNYAINLALENVGDDKNVYYMECGVWRGESANFFSKFVKKYYAFDSFKGLPEEWSGNAPKGTFTLGGKLPRFNKNIIPIVGYVEDTLDDFLKKHKPKIKFVHMDMDTYSPTKFVLERIKPYLVKDAIIVFDEFYNYIGWKNGEYKAFKEVFKDTEFTYKAFVIKSAQAVIQIIK